MRAWLACLFVLAPTVGLASSCALDSFEKVEPTPDAGEACGHASVPEPPSPTPENDADPGEEFVVALRVLRLKTDSQGVDLGLDLDRFCSCQGEGRSCVPPEGQPEEISCDKSQGRDNQIPALFNYVELALQKGDLSKYYTGFAEVGNWSVLFHVSGYNGQPNDAKVRVAWYGSPGTAFVPAWQGSDAWPIATSALLDPTNVSTPRYVDDFAYVANGTLVLSAPAGGIEIAGGKTRLRIALETGTISARIEKDDQGRYVLRDGLIAGRIPQPELFAMIASYRDDDGNSFCTNNPFWGVTQDLFCRGLDIQTGPPEQNKPCNAVSFAAGFDADPAMLGAPTPPAADSPGCAPEFDPVAAFMTMGCTKPMPMP
ncbi:hypothetical protein [Polyangium spumosum]|uniref:Lipoprotein n=1 Tax=Polyangium spumosum TaxID=889282 RepID=A0A6N7PKA7_9BACT|nr:hypothetical protein [Polyangium spumosum]MRG90650.1 hypothetical protein [Polyangium spumosum]